MHKYFINTPWIVKKIFPNYIWNFPSNDNAVYLTFDDGPHPTITPWVLDELKKHDAQATFFCIGKNVERYPEIYQRIIEEGHAVGNHSYSHLNGWKVDNDKYIADIRRAKSLVHSNLYRPPYGRIRSSQAKEIAHAMERADVKIIMWDILTADFDQNFSPAQCFAHITDHVEAGSIIVFHDSEKAWNNLQFVLPEALVFLSESKYRLKKIE
jgi:peptidoglycan/xylan/chitin deacetylase (PgdA/CDA1 family)